MVAAPMMTPKEVALACDVHHQTVLRWIRSQGLPARRRGLHGAYELEPAAVVAWCDQRGVAIFNPFAERVAE